MNAIAEGPDTERKNGVAGLTLNVPQQQQARSSRQQAADACVEYWNAVLAAEGSFADERSMLTTKGVGEK
jgi:hypothetical protein